MSAFHSYLICFLSEIFELLLFVKYENAILIILFHALSSFFISFQEDVRKGEHVEETDRECVNIQSTGGEIAGLFIKVKLLFSWLCSSNDTLMRCTFVL